jgi:hypothetical protein
MTSFARIHTFVTRRPFGRVARDGAVQLWRDLKAEWRETQAVARGLAATLLRRLSAHSHVAALIGLLGVGVACMTSACAEIGPAAQPAATEPPALSSAAASGASADKPWTVGVSAGSQAAGAAASGEDPQDARQKAWAKFFLGFYLSSFVALGLSARISDA